MRTSALQILPWTDQFELHFKIAAFFKVETVFKTNFNSFSSEIAATVKLCLATDSKFVDVDYSVSTSRNSRMELGRGC